MGLDDTFLIQASHSDYGGISTILNDRARLSAQLRSNYDLTKINGSLTIFVGGYIYKIYERGLTMKKHLFLMLTILPFISLAVFGVPNTPIRKQNRLDHSLNHPEWKSCGIQKLEIGKARPLFPGSQLGKGLISGLCDTSECKFTSRDSCCDNDGLTCDCRRGSTRFQCIQCDCRRTQYWHGCLIRYGDRCPL